MSYSHDACATFDNLLATLEHLAGKARDGGLVDSVLEARLADDMFPLETQFRVAINQVILALTRLAGSDLPLDETPYASLAAIGDRLGALRASVAAAREAEWQAGDSTVDYTLPNGMRFVMTAAEYIRDWTLPNFYFHATMAYALLRHQGLAIGKADFVPHMLRYAKAPAA